MLVKHDQRLAAVGTQGGLHVKGHIILQPFLYIFISIRFATNGSKCPCSYSCLFVLYKQFVIMDILDTDLKWEIDDLTLSQVSTMF